MTIENTTKNNDESPDDFTLHISEVSRILRVTDRTIRRYVNKGLLHPKRTGSFNREGNYLTEHGFHNRFSQSEVEALRHKQLSGKQTSSSDTPSDSNQDTTEERLPALPETMKAVSLIVQHLQAENSSLHSKVIELSEAKGKYEERSQRIPVLEEELKTLRTALTSAEQELLSAKKAAASVLKLKRKPRIWAGVLTMAIWLLCISGLAFYVYVVLSTHRIA